jgi:flagellar protein FliS
MKMENASPVNIVLMMYDGSINYLRKAVEYGEQGNMKHKNIYTNKCRDIIAELKRAIDFEAGGEIAINLNTFYRLIDRMLLGASQSDDLKTINQVIDMLGGVKDAWQFVATKAQGGELENCAVVQ